MVAFLAMPATVMFGQGTDDDWNKVPDYIGKSPEAASFLRYGDYNVNLSKGSTDISIPLHTLKAGDFSLPISLSYNPKGIKVDQEASWVGLGWDLNAGASIILDVRDTPDESVIGLMPDLGTVGNTISQIPYWDFNNSVLADLRRQSFIKDVYHFSSPTVSGKFIIGDSAGRSIKVYPPGAFKVEVPDTPGAQGFKITDPYGNQYLFYYTREISTTTGVSGSQPYTSAWYVDKIKTNTNQEINFTYINDGWHGRKNMDDRIIHTKTKIGCQVPANGAPQQTEALNVQSQPNNSSSITKTYKLASIDYGDQRISFESVQGRLDLASPALISQAMYPSYNIPPGNLRFLKIQYRENGTYSLVKGYEFVYSYFNAAQDPTTFDYLNKRLKLDRVVDMIDDTQSTSFAYSTVSLPSKQSRARDAWGYYNGKSNLTMVPAQYINFIPSTAVIRTLIGGGIRDVDPAFLQAGMLTEIQYPTKGKTRFTYEPNQYYGPNPLDRFQIYTLSYNAVQGSGTGSQPPNELPGSGDEYVTACNQSPSIGCVQYGIVNFTAINATAMLTFSMNNTGGTGPTVVKYKYCRVRVIVNGTSVVYDSGKLSASTVLTIPLTLAQSGVIVIEAYGDSMSISNLQLKYTNGTIIDKNNYGPGLRISAIENYSDSQVPATKKKYTYELDGAGNKSSGRLIFGSTLIFDPYVNTSYVIVECAPPSGTATVTPVGWKSVETRRYTGHSVFFDMNDVSYTNVREENIDLATALNNGYAKYKFNFAAIEGSQDGLIMIENDWKRGELLEKKIYKRELDRIVSSETNTYFDDSARIVAVSGFKLFTRSTFVTSPNAQTPPDPGTTNMENMGYSNPVYWHYLKSSRTVNYFYNTSNVLLDSISTSKDYTYGNPVHLQPTAVTTANSLGESLQQVTRYANDIISNSATLGAGIPASGLSALNAMILQNNIATPVQTESYNNGELMQSQRKLFRDWGNGLLAPEIVQSSKAAAAFENRIRYSLVDTYGNPLEVQQENGSRTAYIWGYNGQYVVAKMDNMPYGSIPAALIAAIQAACSPTGSESALLTALNNLRNDPALAGAMVTTLTYRPLVGVSSITDPKGDIFYYTYDSLGRLATIKDRDGRIISENDYHYKN